MDSKATTASFKLFFGESDVRRVSLPMGSFEAAVAALQKLYSAENLFHPELRIQYYDSEGDKCTVSTQVEWEEMIQQVAARPIKLYISDSSLQGRYFKDGPAPEARFFYTDEKDPQPAPKGALLNELELNVPACLARLFPSGKILPYNLPAWLRDAGCITLKRINNDPAVVDMDIDIIKLFDVLHAESLEHFGTDTTPRNLERAKDFLYCMLTLKPSHPLALYNLACAEALLGNANEAVDALVNAVNGGGYSNWRHMEKDSDLDSLRGHERYQALLDDMKENDEEVKEERRRKEEAAQAKIQEERQRIVAEEEAKRKREEEEKKRKLEEAARKREEEERQRIAAEEEAKRKREEEEEKRKREEEQKKRDTEAAKKRSDDEKVKKVKESPYKVQLETLIEMGFDDVDICEFLLKENKGDVGITLAMLLEGYPQGGRRSGK